MTSKMFVTILLISSCFSLGSQLQYLDLEKFVERTKLYSVSFDSICDPLYMKNFHEYFFLKAFVNFEENPNVPFITIVRRFVGQLEMFKTSLDMFIQKVEKEVTPIKTFPGRYLNTKLTFLMDEAKKIVGLPLRGLPQPTSDSIEGVEALIKDTQNIRAELLTTELSLDYLKDAKAQLINVKNKEYDVHAIEFKKGLPKVLRAILEHVIPRHKDHRHDKDIMYLIDFFEVFGDLVGEKDFAQIVLETLIKHPKPVFQDPSLPAFFLNKDMYTPENPDSEYKPLLKIDKLFNFVDPSHRQVINIIDTLHNKYTHHPDWLSFFDIKAKPNPLTHTNPEKLEKITNKGHKYIYYLYTHLRHLEKIPLELNKAQVGELLYDWLLTNKCYTEQKVTCGLSQLISKPKFVKYYIVMLTLLKPFSKNPDNFTPEEVDIITKNGMENGIELALKYAPNIADKFPDLLKKQEAAVANNVVADIDSLLDSLPDDEFPEHKGKEQQQPNEKELPEKQPEYQLNKDQDPKKMKNFPTKTEVKDPIKSQKQTREKIQKRMGDVKKIVERGLPGFLDPEVDKLDLDKHKRNADAVLDIANTSEDPAMKNIVLTILETSFKNLDTLPLAPEQKEIVDGMKKDLVDKVIEEIHSVTPLSEDHPFLKYLMYTVQQQKTENANGEDLFYFKDARYNYLRHVDLYVFYYKTYERELKDIDGAILDKREELIETEHMDFAEIEKDLKILESRASLEFFSKFFGLFRLFEVEQSDVDQEEHNGNAKYGDVFNKIYKFLADVRLRTHYVIENPREAAFLTMQHCMDHWYNKIVATKPDDVNDPNNLFNDQDNEDPCILSYSELSEIYPFVTVWLSDGDKSMVEKHSKFMGTRTLINSDTFYRYIADSKFNRMKGMFNVFCETLNDSLCYGWDLYTKLGNMLSKNQLKLINDKAWVTNYINQQFSDYKEYMKADTTDFRLMMWNLMSSLSKYGNEKTNNSDLLSMIIEFSAFKFSETESYSIIGLHPNSSAEERKYLTLFLALKFTRSRSQIETVDDKIYKGVRYLFKHDMQAQLIANPTFVSSNALFLTQFASRYQHFEKIVAEMLKYKVSDVLRWKSIPPLVYKKVVSKIMEEKTTRDCANIIMLALDDVMDQKNKEAEKIIDLKNKDTKTKQIATQLVKIEFPPKIKLEMPPKSNLDDRLMDKRDSEKSEDLSVEMNKAIILSALEGEVVVTETNVDDFLFFGNDDASKDKNAAVFTIVDGALENGIAKKTTQEKAIERENIQRRRLVVL